MKYQLFPNNHPLKRLYVIINDDGTILLPAITMKLDGYTLEQWREVSERIEELIQERVNI